MPLLALLAACALGVVTEGVPSYPSSTWIVTTTTFEPCYQFLTTDLKGGAALYFHRRLSPTKHLVRIGHCRSCGHWNLCRNDAKVVDNAFLKALDTGPDFSCYMLWNKTCGKLTEALPRHPSMSLASLVASSGSPQTAATWPLVILAVLCWIGCAGSLVWLLFRHGAAHLSGKDEDSGSGDERHPCISVRSIPETSGVKDFDIITVGPDGFRVRPAGEEEFDVVTVDPEGFEVRSATGKKAMHTTILKSPMGTVQQGMNTTVLESSMGTVQQGMHTTILESPTGTLQQGMQTTVLEQPPQRSQWWQWWQRLMSCDWERVRPETRRNAMHTTISESPTGTVQQGMHTTILEPGMNTTILEPPMGTLQQGMQTTFLEQPPLTHNHGMQT